MNGSRRPRTPRTTLAAVTAILLLAALVAVTGPQVISVAADLVTSRDIKDGTIKRADLAPKVRKKLGVPGAAGPAGPAGPQGPAGQPGAPGAPGAPASPAILMGRINNPGGEQGCVIGAPVGVTTVTSACAQTDAASLMMSLPQEVVVANLTASVATPAESANKFWALHAADTFCTIPVGERTCTVDAFTLQPGEGLAVELDWSPGSVPSVSFSFELRLTQPGTPG